MRKKTRVTHPPEVPVPPDNRPLVAPIYQSVKFTFDDVGETQKYWIGERAGFYSRVSNPDAAPARTGPGRLQGGTLPPDRLWASPQSR
jgi:methionine-gamma-lyase